MNQQAPKRGIFQTIKEIFSNMPTMRDWEKLLDRCSFEKYLPWVSYDPEHGIYSLDDQSIGFLWACYPHAVSTDVTAKELEGFFNSYPLPDNTVVSFSLLADDKIDYFLEDHKKQKTRNIPVIKEAAAEICNFLQSCTHEIPQMQGTPLRTFRLFIALKIPLKDVKKQKIQLGPLKTSMTKQLKSAGFHPSDMNPPQLLAFARRFFNPDWGKDIYPGGNDNLYHYLEDTPIFNQVITSETPMEAIGNDRIKIGEYYFDCLSLKSQPEEWSMAKMNEIIGHSTGIRGDSNQITSPFLFTTNLVKTNLKYKLVLKNAAAKLQMPGETTNQTVLDIRRECSTALKNYATGKSYYRCQPILWIWNKDPDALDRAITQAKNLFSLPNFIMQKEAIIMYPMLAAALPFGLRNFKGTLDKFVRDFPVPTNQAMLFLPTQADFNGNGLPSLLFVGRKGQLIAIDIFSPQSTNYNGFVCAKSGKGKSVVINYLISNYFGKGEKIRLFDIGGSYKKMGTMYGAKYMDFTPEQNICLNPFGFISDKLVIDDDPTIEPDQRVLNDLQSSFTRVARMIGLMAVPDRKLTKTETTILKRAVQWAWEKNGSLAIIDDVQDYLDNLKHHFSDEVLNISPAIEKFHNEYSCMLNDTYKDQKKVHASSSVEKDPGFNIGLNRLGNELALNLSAFSSLGEYGYYFCGKSNFDIEKEDFVILELDYLQSQPVLFELVTTILVEAITLDLYLSDRKEKRLIIFDEAHQFLTKESLMSETIDKGYRVARKYGGGFWTITQSPTDLAKFGKTGDVIWENSSYKFMLNSSQYRKAKEMSLIDVKEHELALLESINTNKEQGSYYSEIFIITDDISGVGRLILDDFSFFAYNTEAKDFAEIETMIKEGLSYTEAIREMIRRHR